jgi:hypothetical protein
MTEECKHEWKQIIVEDESMPSLGGDMPVVFYHCKYCLKQKMVPFKWER